MLRLNSIVQTGVDVQGTPQYTASFTDPASGTTLTKANLTKEEAASYVLATYLTITLTPTTPTPSASVAPAPLTP